MTDERRENRRLWDAWSDDFQAIWNANTAEGEAPPAPSPFALDAPGGRPEFFEGVEGRDYVELGCGGGQGTVGTADLGAAAAVGVDFSGEQLAHARRLRDFYGVDAQFVQGDVTAVPFANDSFDLASSEAAFQMISDLDGALAEARRVLRDGGVFVLSVPHPLYEGLDADSATFEGSFYPDGPREIIIDEEYGSQMVVFDRRVGELHNALEAAGFDVRRVFEHRHPNVTESDPADSDLPDVLWDVPRSARFWAVAR